MPGMSRPGTLGVFSSSAKDFRMAYSSFFSRLANDAILEHYAKVFAKTG